MSDASVEAALQGMNRVVVQLRETLIERDKEIALAMLALIARQHLFLLGPPGTAKSFLASQIGVAAGATFFERLLTRFTDPAEVFGPLNVKRFMEETVWEREVTGYMPTAEVVFLDEALATDTPIPTPTGWTTMGAIQVGDLVLGAKGAPTRVLSTTPVVQGDCYRVEFDDHSTLIADAGHRWLVRRAYKLSPWRVMTTLEMVQDGGKFQVPLAEPTELPEAVLPIDPYLLGAWLGNGNSWNAEVYIRAEWAESTAELFRSSGYQTRVEPGSAESIRKLVLTGTDLRTCLREAGLIGSGERYSGTQKAVPPVYLRGSINQRLALLRGLMDTDGHMMEGGTCVFSNTNENVVDGVVEILGSLGIRCSKRPTNDLRVGARGQHKQCWKVTFRADPARSPFLVRDVAIPPILHDRVIRIAGIVPVDSVPVRCITVDAPDHLFLAGVQWRVTHNCWKASSAILNSLLTIVNERKFDNGTGRISVPLETLFGASNELPQDESLGALYDRFLLRVEVLPVQTPEGQAKLLEPRPKVTARLKDLQVLQAACTAVVLGPTALTGMIQIRDALWREGIPIGDRRFQQSASLVRAAAVLDGVSTAVTKHLWPLQYAYWQTPDQIETVRRVVTAHMQAGPQPAAQPLPGGYGNTKPPPPRNPPLPQNTGQFGAFSDIDAHLRRSSSVSNASNAALHRGIEALLNSIGLSAAERRQLEQWKSAIRTSSGGSWLV